MIDRATLLRSPGLIELFLWVLIGVPTLMYGGRSRARGRISVWRWISRLGRQKRLSVVVVGLFALFLSASRVAIKGTPVPRVGDEFSYLLASDTFAHGRLSNPTPHAWEFFETFNVLQQPRYASMFPPGQGIFLAIGQLFTGRPYVGVWLSMAFALGALTWMLQAWAPAPWALCAGLLAAARLTFLGAAIPGTELGYWSHSYWGGAVAMGGGALVFGALRRLLSRGGAGSATILGIGLVLLAFSRPFEGLVVALPVAAVLVRWVIATKMNWSRLRIVLPIFGCLVIGGSALAWYNRAVTGEPLLLPHVAYQQQYFIAPNFLWGPIRPEPAYRHQVLAEYYLDLLRRYYDEHQWSVLLVTDVARLIALGSFFGAGLFFIPLVALGAALRDHWTRFAIGTTMILVLASLQVTYLTLPHYIAPAACLIAAVLLRTTRCLRLWHWKGRPIGRALVGALPIIFVTSVLMSLSIPDAPGWSMHRATIERKLERDGRRHLVVVRYAQDHNPHQEWVYNRADIDEAPVVWARDMGLDQNRRLLEHFGARRVWLLDADSEPPRIVRFPSDETEPPTTEENPFS